jgi:hypothetical protein
VEGVAVGDPGSRTPVWIFSPDQVAAIEVVVGVELVTDLRIFRYSPA